MIYLIANAANAGWMARFNLAWALAENSEHRVEEAEIKKGDDHDY
jgi:hypothetical protein